MKFVSALLLAATAADAAVLKPRQLFGGLFGGGGLKVARVEKLQAEVRPNAIRSVQSLGPITLRARGAGEQDSGQQNFIWTLPHDAVCKDCTVLRGHIGLADAEGKKIVPQKDQGVYIHHLLTFDTSKRTKPFVNDCIGGLAGLLGAKFVGSGEDNNNVPVYYTDKDGSHQGGFHVGRFDSFSMNADLVNMNTASTQVYLTLDIEYLPGIVGTDSRETLLSVEACGGSWIRTSTAGETNSTSGKYTFNENGSIVLGKGHLHAGGEGVAVFINNKLVCESKAQYGGAKGEAAINGMSVCPKIDVKSGDVMTFTVMYDVAKHPVRHESHGMMGGMPDIMGMFDLIFSANT